MFDRIELLTNNPEVDTGIYWELSHSHFRRKDWENHPGDRFCNPKFNQRLYTLIPNKCLNTLEIGCGDGAATASLADHGHTAIGLDACTWWKEFQVNGWNRHPDKLFLCDVGKEFFLLDEYLEIFKFDVIFSYECFEHIHEPDIPQLALNIAKHSKAGTYLIFSASQTIENGHKCLHDRNWWTKVFEKVGFANTNLNFGADVIRNESSSLHFYMIYVGLT